MAESWKSIDGFDNYAVSDDGRVINKKRGIEKALKIDRYGYGNVALYRDGKEYHRKVHRLVAEAYIENDGNKPQVNHIDGNKLNNNVDNLEWVTCSENMKHAYETGLNPKHASYGMRGKKNPNGGAPGKPVIINETGEVYKSIVECAKAHNFREKSITEALHGRCKTHRGYSFSFYEEHEHDE